MTIKVLDSLTAEQIAAGEVIENPASVVKELVENSLDAGASRIEIKLEEGGKKSLTVSDDGDGILPEELPLAFKRFATSKLSSLQDLDTLTSLGFRGEALPSIAAVARVTLTTRPRSAQTGTRIRLAASRVLSLDETGAPEGTAVEVRDLFYNTPGRLKFLRAPTVESARVTALISGLALAHPRVAFTLAGETKTVIRTSGDGNLIHVIGELYGSESAAAMTVVRDEDPGPGISLTGYLAAPHVNRASRRQVTVIVNGRVVKNALIAGALERGYSGFLPRQRHPVAVLHLQVPPALLDVNVHPAKAEIRFQQPEAVKDLVYRAVRSFLHRRPLSPSRPLAGYGSGHQPGLPAGGQTDLAAWHEEIGGYTLKPGEPEFRVDAGAGFSRPGVDIIPGLPGGSNGSAPHREQPGDRGEAGASTGPVSLIGQFLNSYLVAHQGDLLLLIDQHAAHERVIYEALAAPGPEAKQGDQLTLPVTIEIPVTWRESLDKLLPLLSEMGFKMEPFGDNSYIIRAVPHIVSGPLTEQEIYAMLEDLVMGEPDPGESRRDRLRKTVSCHRAIKAHQPLSRAEMQQLLEAWVNTPGARYCPHGRPAVLGFSRASLEKGFRRKGETPDER